LHQPLSSSHGQSRPLLRRRKLRRQSERRLNHKGTKAQTLY